MALFHGNELLRRLCLDDGAHGTPAASHQSLERVLDIGHSLLLDFQRRGGAEGSGRGGVRRVRASCSRPRLIRLGVGSDGQNNPVKDGGFSFYCVQYLPL